MATMLPPEGDADSLNKPTKIIPKANKKPVSTSTSDEPQPKWHILRLTNYVVTFGFLFSVLQFASNASTYLEDSSTLLQYLVIWSVFMCYFFGFFGISFIELDDLGSEPRNQQHQVVHRQQMTNNERLVLSYILLCSPPNALYLELYNIMLLMCVFVPIHLHLSLQLGTTSESGKDAPPCPLCSSLRRSYILHETFLLRHPQ